MSDMNPLFRVIHPALVHDNRLQSAAFKPRPCDDRHLSTYNGEIFSARQAFEHFTEKSHAVGILHVTESECSECNLTVEKDNDPFYGHASIVFGSELSNNQVERVAKKLTTMARMRGWDYPDNVTVEL